MEKKLEIKHRMRRHEILKNKKKQMYIAKKAELEAKKATPIPEIKVSNTAEKVLKNIRSIKNKKLVKKLNDNIKLDKLKGKTRYNFLKEIKEKLDLEEKEENKKKQEIFFTEMNKKKEKKQVRVNNNFGLLRF